MDDQQPVLLLILPLATLSGLEGTDKNGRIDAGIIKADVPVHMRARRTAGGAHFTHHIASRQLLTDLCIHFRHVAKHADKALAVVDKYGVAVKKVVTYQNDLSRRRGLDRRARRHSEIETCVRIALFAIEESTNAELARQRPVDGFIE